MKRFWKEAAAVEGGSGWGIALDSRPLRTPARAALEVPSRSLAQAIVGEWSAAGESVDPRAMPLTGLANAAIDRIAPDPSAFAAGLAQYAGSDLACYRADNPQRLAELQAERWDALLAWARRRFDVDFATTCGVMHVDQPPATLDRLSHEIAILDPFRLAGLAPLVTLGGSLVAGLAVLEGAMSPEEAWAAVTVDEQWQRQQWGADAEADAALDSRRREFLAAARFLELLDD